MQLELVNYTQADIYANKSILERMSEDYAQNEQDYFIRRNKESDYYQGGLDILKLVSEKFYNTIEYFIKNSDDMSQYTLNKIFFSMDFNNFICPPSQKCPPASQTLNL